ncbi:hypothetical protein GmHk_18G051919 [Glycine max]|nr:hypothetical protein GmHk_18G051919 [Glycine max]
MVSRGIFPFKKHIAAVGTTNNNMLSKRKTLDEGSLLSSKSETQHDHRFTSTAYVPMDPGIGPLFSSPCVQIVLVFVCIK